MIVSIALAITAALYLPRYMARPARSFCAELTPAATPESVLSLARARGLAAFDLTDRRGVVSVLSRRMPFFRAACEVRFDRGRFVAAEVVAAD